MAGSLFSVRLTLQEQEGRCVLDSMNDLLKSAGRLGWATSLLGVRHLNELLISPPSSSQGAGIQHTEVQSASRRKRDVDGLLGEMASGVYNVSRRVQQQTTALISDIFSGDGLTPRLAVRTLFQIMQDSAGIVELITPHHDGQIAWRELQNKLQSFYLFEHVDSVLSISGRAEPSLPELLDRASRLGPFFSVWATEGLGHYYSDWHLSHGSLPDQLLSGPRAPYLPPASLIPLHAGLGLSFVESLLRATDKGQLDAAAVVSTLIQFCHNNVQRGFQGEVWEALGLAARNLYPHLVAAIDLLLSRIDSALQAYFWHGVGRAIYFAPTNFLPFRNAPWKAVQMCLVEPSHSLGKRNALAGFSWALTLVNLRNPEVMATFLKHHWKDIVHSDAFANGVCSAIVVWHDSAPSDDDLDAFYRYEPPKSDPSLIDLWHKYVTQTRNDALRYHRVLAKHNALGEIFRYRNLPDFIRTLECTSQHFKPSVADA